MSKISQPVKLKFDPDSLDGEVGEVFQDDLARVLWMGIKSRHITSQFFDQDCLRAADVIRSYEDVESPERLRIILNTTFRMVNFSSEFVEDLYPYIVGDQELKYEVNLEQ